MRRRFLLLLGGGADDCNWVRFCAVVMVVVADVGGDWCGGGDGKFRFGDD